MSHTRQARLRVQEKLEQGLRAEREAHKAVVAALAHLDYELAAKSLALAAQIRGTIIVWQAIIGESTPGQDPSSDTQQGLN